MVQQARVHAPWPQQEELLTSYSAQVGMSGRSGTPGGAGPARRQGQHSKAHLPQPSAWAQPEPAASRGSATGMPSGGGAAQMPRVSQPLRVEPPVEFNSPRRTAIGKPAAGRPNASQLKDYAVLASACRRAGKPANAAQLMFNRGVLHDNAGEAAQALR